jgi:hypothetical protein
MKPKGEETVKVTLLKEMGLRYFTPREVIDLLLFHDVELRIENN